jgi:hypothetical protein
VPVLRKVHVFQKYSPGESSVLSGGFSPTKVADAIHPGLDAATGVLAEPASGVDVAGRVGTDVSVGRAETSVREFCACTVCATAVAMSFCGCAGLPQEAVITAMHIKRDIFWNLFKVIYFLSLWLLLYRFQKTPDFVIGRFVCIRVLLFAA